MIERYTRPEMGAVWSLEKRFECMMSVEIAVAEVQASLGIIPKEAAVDIRQKSKFSVKRIATIEKKTKHDVIAFVSNLAENVGPSGRYIHFGLTSSDVLDTALSIQVKEAWLHLKPVLKDYERALRKITRKHKKTICAGRTHGMHAEPTSFGLKMAGFLAEFKRNLKRMDMAVQDCMIVKLSGAVGTYSAMDQRVERKVAQKLGLKRESVATQVIPRDRHAHLIHSMALMGAGIERLSVELRHLQRTEVSEVIEGFTPGQKGSSAMPHKKNPISAENLTGIARLLRSYSQASLENIALWHERDISHSSVERVILPDAFILLDYALARMTGVLNNLFVDKLKMKHNMDLSRGQLYSSHLLLILVEAGLSREDAYKLVQKLSHNLKSNEQLQEVVMKQTELMKVLDRKDLDEVFSGRRHKQAIGQLVDTVLKELS